MADIGGSAVQCNSLEEALNGADVIVTVTMATEPLVLEKWLKPGAVICSKRLVTGLPWQPLLFPLGVGACRPDQRELDDDIMHNAVLVVDSIEAALAEAGDIIASNATIFAEIGQLLSGQSVLPSQAETGKKFVVFKSVGISL